MGGCCCCSVERPPTLGGAPIFESSTSGSFEASVSTVASSPEVSRPVEGEKDAEGFAGDESKENEENAEETDRHEAEPEQKIGEQTESVAKPEKAAAEQEEKIGEQETETVAEPEKAAAKQEEAPKEQKTETVAKPKKAAAEKKPAEKKPAAKKTGPEFKKPEIGCYLVYDPCDRGKLMLSWSKTPVEGALAVSYPPPDVTVQPYKLKGKQEVCRGVQSSREPYFSGWISYIKAVLPYSCFVKLLPPPEENSKLLPPTKLAFHMPDKSVIVIDALDSELEPLWIKDADAVAAYPSSSDGLDGLQVVHTQIFIQKGRAIEDGDAQAL